MVFFTLVNLYSALPDPLDHNIPGTFHLGDLVLPMFLFSSGMSLQFFRIKHEANGGTLFLLDSVGRLGRLVMISIFISPLASGAVLGMDEVMLSAILSVPTIMLAGASWMAILAAALASLLWSPLAPLIGIAIDPSARYLGGYAAAPAYLFVMLAGLSCGRRLWEGKGLMTVFVPLSVLALALSLLLPVDKMHASPAFMAIASAASLGLYMALDKLGGRGLPWIYDILEYLGRRPIRYWVLMFVLFFTPALVWIALNGNQRPFGEDWVAGSVAAIASLFAMYLAARALDSIAPHIGRLIVARRRARRPGGGS